MSYTIPIDKKGERRLRMMTGCNNLKELNTWFDGIQITRKSADGTDEVDPVFENEHQNAFYAKHGRFKGQLCIPIEWFVKMTERPYFISPAYILTGNGCIRCGDGASGEYDLTLDPLEAYRNWINDAIAEKNREAALRSVGLL